ncbi:MAG: hypothetical protein AAI946_00045 [Candidatus Hodgkinia cicadicola]
MLALPISGIGMVYKHGIVLRLERHCDLGRFRQFVQFDFDVFGLRCLLSDIWVMCWVFELMCLFSCIYCVKCVLNTKRVLLGLSEVLGVLRYPAKRVKLLCVLDKSATLACKDVLSLLTVGRFDVSGAFVPGLGMSFKFVSSKLDIMYARVSNLRHPSNFRLNLAFLLLQRSCFGELGIRELLYYSGELLVCGLLESFVVLKPLFNRGLEYYTGAIFEVISEIVLLSERNVFVKIGSLIGGGRFDYYVASNYAVGCSIGVSRSLTFLSCIRHDFKRTIAYSVCINNTLANGLGSAWLSRELIRLGFNVTILSGLSFASALKFANKSAVLLFRSFNGWVVKLLFKRAYLQFKVFNSNVWRSLFIDQFWINDNSLFANAYTLLTNLMHCYARV